MCEFTCQALEMGFCLHWEIKVLGNTRQIGENRHEKYSSWSNVECY